MNDNDRIGYLVAFPSFSGVCCQACLDAADPLDDPRPVSLYRVNIGPYRQTCHGCGKQLVEPRTPIWPELFVKTDLTQHSEWTASEGSALFIDQVNRK